MTQTVMITGASAGIARATAALYGRRGANVTLVRGAYGIALCCAPGPLIRLSGSADDDPRARAVAWVLGARHLVQAAVTASRPSPAVVALGAGADVLHSASMLALAAADAPRRRLGLTDGLIAAAFAAEGIAAARAGSARPA
jgi:NAD(P)-dependent dehydrogenase (short-subunit alcohol dehydrogenase family)